jgi:hypothetical protein
MQCWSCRRLICMTIEPVTRALCLLCQAAEEGRELPEHIVREYERMREQADVSLLMVEPEPLAAQGRARFADLMGAAGRAVGFLRRKKPPPGQAQKLAVSKRRGTLLENLQLGSMEEVDRKLREGGDQ